MKLTLFNSISRKTEVFEPIDANLIKMYVCGPTVYDHPHIGNARSVVVYDLLFRVLKEIYGTDKVRYVRNITDIDDKIINRAAQDNITIEQLTSKTTKYFHDDMDYLGCLRPSIEPKATQHLDGMINIIEKLLAKDIAYISNNHVYFDITKANDYYKLSGRSADKMLESVRIDSSAGKRNPGDFVLWKPAKENDPDSANFDSPFGFGRPGWHIECSAMIYRFLGPDFDIHGGGADLIFPHHTNEIAQSCCAHEGSSYARFWVHNGFLTVNHEKMSKSLNNFLTVKDLIKKEIKGEVLRMFLLNGHYRKPIDYNDKAISDAKQMLDYWYRALEKVQEEITPSKNIPEEFLNALLDDLNTNNAIRIINDMAKEIFSNDSEIGKKDLAANMLACANLIGFLNVSAQEWFSCFSGVDVAKIEELIEERQEAKQNKDWGRADAIRDELKNIGIEIEDKAGGKTSWRKL